MDYLKRVEQQLHVLHSHSPKGLRHALTALATTYTDVEPYLRSDREKPYYRKLLFHNDEVELLLMNWSQLACAPHDHGESMGWIQVIDGSTVNTVYACNNGELPEPLFSKKQQHGSVFYAPKAGIHTMKAVDESLVTLHLYSPPIKNMKVYDLELCAACIVSEQCGAWWPEEQREKIKEIQLRK